MRQRLSRLSAIGISKTKRSVEGGTRQAVRVHAVALVGAAISSFKRMIGDALRSRTDRRRRWTAVAWRKPCGVTCFVCSDGMVSAAAFI